MLVLGIETTCDETGAAVVKDGNVILSNIVASQEDLHQFYGGVVPELACRRHIDVIQAVTEKALAAAGLALEDIDLVSVAHGPGLIGALLIGINFAKGLALAANKPIIGVNHVEAHLHAAIMGQTPIYPALGVVLSGGHTHLVKIEAAGSYALIGQTQDDAIGEAFDKVAKLLGLPYPGGPNIECLAKNGDSKKYTFNCGHVKNRPYDFSFSGLKTAVLYLVKGQNSRKDSPLIISDEEKKDVAAAFQHAAFSDVLKKVLLAVSDFGCKSIIVGGGVSQNAYLRQLLDQNINCPIFWPDQKLCLDNAAMIAGLGYYSFINNAQACKNLDAQTRIPFKKELINEKSEVSTVSTAPVELNVSGV